MESRRWGGWGSNPRPADYEKYGPVHRTHYLHGYHGSMPPIALIAPFAPMARSTNRSTPCTAITGCQLQNVTAVGRPARAAPGGTRPPEESRTLLTAEPLDLDYKHEIIRRPHQKRNQATAVRAEMQ
jgi:hypothetical protein